MDLLQEPQVLEIYTSVIIKSYNTTGGVGTIAKW
jgi:hypothetical protein